MSFHPQRAALAAALLLAMSLGGATANAEEKSMERTVTISASGSAYAVPDEATVQSGAMSEAKTAREATTKNTEAMKKIIAELKKANIEAKDIQTSQFSVEPVYVYNDGVPPQLKGYRVHNMLSVKVRNLETLGDVLDQLITAGANQVNGITFDVSKAETLKDDARKAAMSNAMRRAKLYAEAAGAQLGEILQISEDASPQPGPRPAMMRAGRPAMAAEAVPVERGEQELEARVTATWRLK